MKAEGTVGAFLRGEGATAELTFGRNGALRVQQAHASRADAVMRNRVFHQSTAAAGVAPGTALSTTPPAVLYNPTNSGVVAAILKVSVGYVSGTLGAGSIVMGFTPQQVSLPSGGTALTPQNAFLSNAKPQCTSHQGSTLVAAPTILRPVWQLGAALATTPEFVRSAVEKVDGEVVVPPGCAFALQGIAAAGTSPLVLLGITWEEIPIVAA